jgi:hypothetical protein
MGNRNIVDYIKKVLFMAQIVIIATFSFQGVFAGNGPGGRNWQTSDELIQNEQIQAPSPILQVDFRYDADSTPPLKIVKTTI